MREHGLKTEGYMNEHIVTQKAKKTSYADKILSHLQNGGTLSELEAFQKWQMTCFAQRICDLRKLGYPITDTWEVSSTGKRYKRYYLQKSEHTQ